MSVNKSSKKLSVGDKNFILTSVKLAEHEIPSVDYSTVQNSSEQWVPYGSDNSYPEYLNSLKAKSTVHSALIDVRKDLIVSEGWDYSDDVKTFLDSINSEGQSVDDFTDETSDNVARQEGFAVQVIYSKNRKDITDLYPMDYTKFRASKELDKFGRPVGYWYSQDWKNIEAYVPQFYPKFNIAKPGGTQVFLYHSTVSGNPWLPEVSYIAANPYIEVAHELGKMALSSILNGFYIGGVLHVKANMSEERQQQLKAKIESEFKGTDNANTMMVIISEDENPVNFEAVAAQDNTNLIALYHKIAAENICQAHRANPIIAAIQSTGSTLGSDGKLFRDSLQIYYNTVIKRLHKGYYTLFKQVFKFKGIEPERFAIKSSALLQNEMPQWLQELIKPELLVADYGYSADDLLMSEDAELVPEQPQLPAPEQTLPEEDAE